MFVVKATDRFVAFMIRSVKDVCVAPTQIDQQISDRKEIAGAVEIGGRIVTVIDVFAVLEKSGILKAIDPQGVLKKLSYGPKVGTQIYPDEQAKKPLEKEKIQASSVTSFAGDGWGVF